MAKEKKEPDYTYYFAESERRKMLLKDILKKGLNRISAYLSVLIAIPAVLGGIWQVLELISIRLQLIRFFSATQLIADGLIVTIFLVVAGIGILMIVGIYVNNPPISPPTVITEKEEPKLALCNFIIAIMVFGGFHFLMNYLSRDLQIKSTGHNLWMLFMAVSVFLIITYGMLRVFTETKFGTGKVDGLIHFHLSYVAIGLYVYSLSRIFIMFHAIFMVPKDLVNTKQIDCKVETMFPNKVYKLEYFNDKYAFVEVFDTIKLKSKDSIAGKILILNFDELLKEKNCSEDSINFKKLKPKIKY